MNIAQKYGITGGLLLGVMVFVGMLTLPDNYDILSPSYLRSLLFWLINTIICVTILYLSASEKRKDELGGYMTLGEGFRYAYTTGLYIILVSTAIAAFYFYVIDPDWFPYAPEIAIEIMEDRTDTEFSEESKSIMMFQYRYITEISVFSRVIGNLIAFLLLALIIGAVLQKPNPKEIKL